jgi:glycosyltransferase involved in cell wall biosynthesis
MFVGASVDAEGSFSLLMRPGAGRRTTRQALKVLLSAFACEPNKGSEFAVGWNWALSLAHAGHDVVVLTRSESRPAIERALASSIDRPRFAYFDVPKAIRWQSRGPLHAHAILWQWLAVDFAQTLHRRENFDRVHHVTYAGLRAPSFMGKLGIPFVFGPVGGGERAPWRLRQGYSPVASVLEMARDAANLMISVSPVMKETFARADRIYVTSSETLELIPARYRQKARVELAIGIDEGEHAAASQVPREHATGNGVRVLYAGRFVDYKGMHLGLPAFARLAKADPSARLTMVGDGPARRRWHRLAQSLGIERQIEWVPWQTADAMDSIYARHHVLLFPSLHDSGGLVALEAMRHGLPVVCLKLGGPAALVNDSCGRVIDPGGKGTAEVVAELGEALALLSQDMLRCRLAEGAGRRSRDFSWSQKVARLYGSGL